MEALSTIFLRRVVEGPSSRMWWLMPTSQPILSGGMGVITQIGTISSRILASETFENINSDISGHDLDGDGVIDRVLLLHGMEPQESGGGPDSIWSHFSQLENEVQSGGEYASTLYNFINKIWIGYLCPRDDASNGCLRPL